MATRTWNKDRAIKRIDAKIAELPLKAIEIKNYVRDTDLNSLPSNVAYRVNGVHLYADILNLRDMLNPTNGKNVALPDDQELEDELVAHTWKQGAGGAVGIVEKDLVKKIIGRSPDRADAVVMAMLPRPSDPIRQPGRPVAQAMG